MEKDLSDTSDRITAVEKDHKTPNKDYNKLQDKYLYLENRSHRKKKISLWWALLRPQREETLDTGAEFFSEVLGKENGESLTVIDRSHRTLAPKPRTGAMIVYLRYYTDS